MGWVLFALLLLAGMPLLCSRSIEAAGTAVTVTSNQSDGTVTVTVSDAELKGKEISVICYAPGASGAYNDLTANKASIVYMNQYTLNGTLSFHFKVKKQLVSGVYTLVVTSEKGQTVNQFRFIPEETAPGQTAAPPGNTSNPSVPGKSVTAKKKVLPAPKGVKAKPSGRKKVKVSWKKVKGAKGYQISVATKKKGKYKVKLTVKGSSKKKATLKKMKSGKVYYMKVRAYQLSGKKKRAGSFNRNGGLYETNNKTYVGGRSSGSFFPGDCLHGAIDGRPCRSTRLEIRPG